jgi:hypothetical protein
VSALDVEPLLPACHLCGSTAGPWLPDPEADRWPSGAQRLICSRRCAGEPAAAEGDADDVLVLPAEGDQPVPHTVTDAAEKDTHQGESTLTSDILAFLAAVRDALTLSFPDITVPGGYDERGRLMSQSAAAVRSAAAVAVQMGTPSWSVLTESVRDATESIPVTYAVRQDTAAPDDAAKDACGYCRHPFDPADTRWDGQARYGDTPWCRACVDRCHDTEIADHRCPVCAGGER